MKQKFLIVFLFFAGIEGWGQQRPHYTQYILNNYILNPALSGIENYVDVKFSVRDQWVGLSGAPKTTYFFLFKVPLEKKIIEPVLLHFRYPEKTQEELIIGKTIQQLHLIMVWALL